MISFYLLWCLSYLLLILWMRQKWHAVDSSNEIEVLGEKVTLLIPFRNEEKNVTKLLTSLQGLNYPNLEILLVDDQSEDDSFHSFAKQSDRFPNLKVLKSPGIGKKAALAYGISEATGSIVLTSDADCEFQPGWIQVMTTPFINPQIQLVAGPVLIRETSPQFFQRFQQIEWSSILLLTNFSFWQKSPLMCSGANLAFRKSAFEQVNGYQGNANWLSGDDEFLLKKVRTAFGEGSCSYLCFQEALVFTEPQASWISLLNQRIRWAGKWRLHPSFYHMTSSLAAFFIQVGWISSILFFLNGQIDLLFLGLIWASKIQAERFALGKVLKSLGVSLPIWDFILVSFIHPFYSMWVGIGAIQGKFVWKGRTN